MEVENTIEENEPPTAWPFLRLLLFYIIYLLVGGGMFMALQFETHAGHHLDDEPYWSKIKEAIRTNTSTGEHQQWFEEKCPHLNTSLHGSLAAPNIFIGDLENSCPELRIDVSVEEKEYKWSYVDALFFSMTVTTTIGYGHLAPIRPWGKVVCMLYALIGIPLTGILLASTSDFFGEKIFSLYRSKLDGHKQRSRIFISAATALYLTLGFVTFIFVPALAFTYIEGWSYLESVYFAFVTLTTIGFGDLVTGSGVDDPALYAFYQIIVITWIVSSLGYWVMVANFITRALRSKNLHASLMRRARVLKMMMGSQHNHDPVFLPQKSKNTMNFMLQLSSVLAVLSDDDQQEIKDSFKSTSSTEPEQDATARRVSRGRASIPLGVPGISSLFTNTPTVSATDLNKKICETITGVKVSTHPKGSITSDTSVQLHLTDQPSPSLSSSSPSLDITMQSSVDDSIEDDISIDKNADTVSSLLTNS